MDRYRLTMLDLSKHDSMLRSEINSILDVFESNTFSMELYKNPDYEMCRSIKLPQKQIVRSEDINKTCSICLNLFESENIVYYLSCQHLFHSSCLDKWNKNTCPYCRKKIDNRSL